MPCFGQVKSVNEDMYSEGSGAGVESMIVRTPDAKSGCPQSDGLPNPDSLCLSHAGPGRNLVS